MEDNRKKFLDFLGAAEGADYNMIVGGQKFTDFSKHPNIVGLRTAEGPSTAAGKYQITGTTYRDVAPKMGINDFSPESQDKIAVELIRRAGALDAVDRGDWNTAINKLGGVWASLPSSNYKQPKRSAEFVQKYLGDFSQPPAMEYGQTSPGSVAPTEGPSQAGLEIAEAQRKAKYGGFVNQVAALPEAISSGFKNENSVYNFFKDQGISKVDPNFSWSDEVATKALEGIPRDNRDYVLQAGSWDEVVARRGRVMDALQRQNELHQMGAAGTVGTLTGALVDLPTLVGFLPVVGEAAIVSRTSRLANALASGVAAGAANVAVDAAMLKYRPTGSTDELYFSALAGLGFGALTGGMINPAKYAARAAAREGEAALQTGLKDIARAIEQDADNYPGRHFPLERQFLDLQQFGRKEANTLQRQEIKDAGLELTDNGKKILDLEPPKALDDVQAVRDEKLKWDREIAARETPAMAQDVEKPSLPSGAPRPAVSTKGMLEELTKSTQDEMVGPLAKRLLDQIKDDVDIYITPKKDLLGDGRSFYDISRHAIFLRKDAPDRIKLHEIAHAVTVQKLQFGRTAPDTVHGKLTADLEAARQEALKAAEGLNLGNESKYYLKDLYEFTAGLYSGKTEFIDFLSKVKTADTGNLLGKVVDVVRKLLGMDAKETNLLLKSMDLTDRLIDTPLDVNFRRPGAADPAFTARMEPTVFHSAPGVEVDEATIKAVTNAGLNEVFGWSFGLEHTLRSHDALPGAKRLADKLIGTTVGYKNHAVVERNAYDQALQLADGWIVSVKKTATSQFEDYFKRSGRKAWERGDVVKDWNEQLGNYVRGFEGDYDKSVIATGDQIRKSLADVVDHINNPAKSTGGTKRGLTQDKYLDEAGNELLTDPLPKNANYLPRQNDVHKWDQMVSQFGREFVEKFWGGAFKSANPDISDALATRFGKWYANAVEAGRKNFDAEFLSEQLRGYDKEALKESMLRNGLSDMEAQELLDGMFPKTSKGQASVVSNTKQRSAIDERFTMDVTVGGESRTVSINDFINTDTMSVIDGYFKRMGGAVSLANHVDVYKASDIGKAILDATTVQLGQELAPNKLRKVRGDLQFVFDRLMHRPNEEFTPIGKAAEMWRNFNVIRLMGAAVYNQVQELSQIIGTMGWKATLDAIPQLGAWRRDLASGKVGNPILNDLENMIGGAGSDLVLRADFNPKDDWVREMGNTAFNRWLDKGDNALRKMSQATLKYTGMTGVMIQQKRVHAIAFINHFFDVANTGKQIGFTADRLAWMGLSEGDVGKVLEGMRKFAKQKDGVSGKKAGTVDWEAWKVEDPETVSKFTTAFQRESRRVVQENDLASAIPMMSKGWAQTTFQFLNFAMQAWNKSLMFAMNHRDFQTLSTVMHGGFFGALVYMARTEVQMAGMPEDQRAAFAERRLSTKQIVANSFGRTSQASLLPNIIDSVSPIPIFSGARTTSDTTDFLTSNPTLSSLNAMTSLLRKGVRNGVSEDYQFTEKDVSTYIRLVPLNNVVGISGLLNSLTKDLPRREEVNPEH
uniref:Internal virion protein n=1 Tax=Ralstonia phage BOESR1 TaxID=3034917 RepID=A0AA49EPK3_9CAUD|nr:internal virion protein [Ralstonia phage BOESR1]